MTKFAKICAVLLFVPVVILSVYMLRLTYLTHFEKVEIAVKGYDPKDFFSGYYVALQPNWQKTNCSQFVGNTCPKKEFAEVYSFYVKENNARKLEKAIAAKNVVLEFSYQYGYQPLITDLKIDGVSYKDYIKEEN